MAPSDDLLKWLEILGQQPVSHELPEVAGWTRERCLDLTDTLLSWRWAEAKVNHGDDRLLSAIDIRLTAIGRSELHKHLMKGANMPAGSSLSIEEKRSRRWAFMRQMYEVTDGSRMHIVTMFDIGESLGWNREETSAIVDYLVSENLLEYQTLGGGISITHYGTVEVEESLSHPTRPTEHFPAVNVISIGTMVGSSIIQDSPASHQQNVMLSDIDLPALSEIITRFLADEVLASPDLSEEDREELAIELQTAQVQLSAKKPKLEKIKASLSRVAQISMDVATTAGSLAKLGDYALDIHNAWPGI